MKNFEMAVQVAYFACVLDDERIGLSEHLQPGAQRLAGALHDYAELLAGERIGEIYGTD